MSEAFTYSELAQILPLSRATIQSLTRKGVLPAERRGRKTYIRRSSVQEFLQRCMTLVQDRGEEEELIVDLDAPEARQRRRYILDTPLAARLTSTDAKIIDIDERGARIRHSRALRIGSEARFSFEIAALQRVWVLRTRITWSRLASDGYISGVEVTENETAMREAVACLERLGAIKPDRRSLQRKRETTMRKEAAVIRATMEQLRRDPIAAQRWYNRARYALAEDSVRRALPAGTRARDEALAIWEALDRRVDLRAVCRIVGND